MNRGESLFQKVTPETVLFQNNKRQLGRGKRIISGWRKLTMGNSRPVYLWGFPEIRNSVSTKRKPPLYNGGAGRTMRWSEIIEGTHVRVGVREKDKGASENRETHFKKEDMERVKGHAENFWKWIKTILGGNKRDLNSRKFLRVFWLQKLS